MRISVDQKRFEILLTTVNQHDPISLVKIAPGWLMDRHISDLGMSVRASNALQSAEVSIVGDLEDKSLGWLLKIPNMGKLSVSDICDAIIKKVQTISHDVSILVENTIHNKEGDTGEATTLPDDDAIPLTDIVSKQPLVFHLNRTLDELGEVDRLVLHERLGASGTILTLEQIAEKLDVTRERIRQRQKKYIEKIISNESWDEVIGIKIGQILLDRKEPLILEMLDVEDSWFKGFDDNYVYLGQVIQMFSENEIRVIVAGGRKVITRISQNDWDSLVRELRPLLKQKAAEKDWTRSDIDQYFTTSLLEYSAQELAPILHEVFEEHLQYENEEQEALLIAYGKSVDSAVQAVLSQAEEPLHYSEITKRASKLLGRNVDERTAHNAGK